MNFSLSFQVKYKRDFEESKGRGFSIVTDTPELQRLKRTQEQISNVGAAFLDTRRLWDVSLDGNVSVSECEVYLLLSGVQSAHKMCQLHLLKLCPHISSQLSLHS